MAVLRLDIPGNPKAIPFRTLLQVGTNSIGVLDDLDHAFSHESQGATEWLMHDLSMNGKIRIEISSRVRQLKKKMLPNVGTQVAKSFVSGFRVLEDEGTTPAYLSEVGMRYAERITRTISGTDRKRVIASVPIQENEVGQAEVEITEKSASNLAKLIPAPYVSLGSVEGHLEGINMHSNPRFIVYEKRTGKAVTCWFGTLRDELMDKIKDSLESRVSVSGRLSRNAKGEPVRIKLLNPDGLKVFEKDLKVLPFKDLRGSDKDFTRGLSIRDFIRSIRG